MLDLPFAAGAFDIVNHSDTLEHVPNPVAALAECRRVLTATGRLCFTIPVIIGRMSRDRTGLPKSYHGNPATSSDDYVVQSEFGADAWTCVLQAGFRHVAFNTVEYPAALAITAWNAGQLPMEAEAWQQELEASIRALRQSASLARDRASSESCRCRAPSLATVTPTSIYKVRPGRNGHAGRKLPKWIVPKVRNHIGRRPPARSGTEPTRSPSLIRAMSRMLIGTSKALPG